MSQELRTQWPEAQLSAALSVSGLIGANGTATVDETKDLVANLDFALVLFQSTWCSMKHAEIDTCMINI